MTVTLDLKPEIEQGLVAQARERGLSLNAFLEEIVSKQASGTAAPALADNIGLKLPIRHLGAMVSLRRRDIYDDGSSVGRYWYEHFGVCR